LSSAEGRSKRIRGIAVAAALVFGGSAWAALDPGRGALSLLLVALALVAAGAAWYETGADSAKEIAIVGTLGGVAAAGRVLLALVPGVQPVTVITIAAGASLGLRAGIGVGATAAFVSNLFLGQGIWTPWQMLAWGACGAIGALARPVVRRRIGFALLAFVLGLGFSAAMDLWEWWSFYPHRWAALTLQVTRGFPFDMAHAVGNVLIVLAAGPELRRVLERYGRRLRTEIVWDGRETPRSEDASGAAIGTMGP